MALPHTLGEFYEILGVRDIIQENALEFLAAANQVRMLRVKYSSLRHVRNLLHKRSYTLPLPSFFTNASRFSNDCCRGSRIDVSGARSYGTTDSRLYHDEPSQ